MNKLTIENVKHTYLDGQKKAEVLKGVTAEFEQGKVYAIVGESGSGKTTLISLISALDRIQEGDIKFNGKSIREIGEAKFRLKYVSIVFQAYNLIKYMTARENVAVGLDFAKHKGSPYELLEKVGIDKEKADRLINKLSGGEQQRVAIARAMAGDFPIIVADEPTGNLDSANSKKIMELFNMMADEGKIVIVVTHSLKLANDMGAAVLNMNSGILS